MKDELAGPLRIMQETARRISRVSNESKLPVDEEEYVNKFRSELMDVVYQWCNVRKHALWLRFIVYFSLLFSFAFFTHPASFCDHQGVKFSDVIKMTDVFEGSIIRTIKRLEELLRQMCAAAKAIGNTDLESKFAEGITKIKRDIVFAASLYL